MQTGHFFELDKNSFLHKGEVVFRYMRIVSEEQPLYPIYISLKSHSIDFYFHGYLFRKLEKNEFATEFIETKLFSIPLSTHETIVNELNKSLENIFDAQFPFLPNYSLNKNFEESAKDCFVLNNSKIPAYTTLPDFRINSQEIENVKNQKQNDGKSKNYYEKKLLLRQLLLDFIFDIQHSEIFRACPYFNNAHQFLKENLFFEAISAKANFYYWLDKCKINKEQAVLLELSKNELKKAKNRWTEIIQKPNADKSIKQTKNNYWFKDIESELNNVFDKSKNVLEVDKTDIATRKESANWFIDRYNILLAHKLIVFPGIKSVNNSMKPNNKAYFFILLFGLLLWSSLFLLPVLFEQFEVIIYSLVGFGLILLIYSLYIVFKIKSISSAFRLIIFNLIILYLSAWFLIFDIDTLRNSLFQTPVSSVYIILAFFLISLLSGLFIYSIERQERASALRKSSSIKTFSLFILSFLYVLLINIIGTSAFASERMPQEYFLEKIWNEAELLGIKDSVNRKEFIKSNAKKMWVDSAANKKEYNQILFVLDSIDVNKLGSDSIFISDNNKINLAKKHNRKRYKDDVLYNHLEHLNLSNTEQKVMYRINLRSWSFHIFPSMLLINTVLALFIGIFIQLIINRKKLTEN